MALHSSTPEVTVAPRNSAGTRQLSSLVQSALSSCDDDAGTRTLGWCCRCGWRLRIGSP
jgi:hypothetical protein